MKRISLLISKTNYFDFKISKYLTFNSLLFIYFNFLIIDVFFIKFEKDFINSKT